MCAYVRVWVRKPTCMFRKKYVDMHHPWVQLKYFIRVCWLVCVLLILSMLTYITNVCSIMLKPNSWIATACKWRSVWCPPRTRDSWRRTQLGMICDHSPLDRWQNMWICVITFLHIFNAVCTFSQTLLRDCASERQLKSDALSRVSRTGR